MAWEPTAQETVDNALIVSLIPTRSGGFDFRATAACSSKLTRLPRRLWRSTGTRWGLSRHSSFKGRRRRATAEQKEKAAWHTAFSLWATFDQEVLRRMPPRNISNPEDGSWFLLALTFPNAHSLSCLGSIWSTVLRLKPR